MLAEGGLAYPPCGRFMNAVVPFCDTRGSLDVGADAGGIKTMRRPKVTPRAVMDDIHNIDAKRQLAAPVHRA